MPDKNKYTIDLAKFISIVCHPIFIYIYILLGLLIPILRHHSLQHVGYQIILYTFIYFIISFSLLAFAYKKSYIYTITLYKREDRLIGYSCFFFPLLILAYIMPKTLPLVTLLLILLIWSFGTIAFVNLFWKMSAHLYFYGSALGFLLYIFVQYHVGTFFLFPPMIVIAGFVAWARLYLNAHNSAHVYVGFISGIIQPFILFPLFL